MARVHCPSCEAEVPAGRFCVECGHRLAGAEQPGPDRPAPASSPEAERRQLTVMFCDLVGSTALSATLDPEDTREVIRAYQDACAGAVTRFGGTVAKYMGDGVLAYFGWPRAHEDDAERAVRAGLELADGVAQLETPTGRTLAARIGIATGVVMVGELIGEGAAKEQRWWARRRPRRAAPGARGTG
jgi:class 3 adenylate cyclase